MSKTAKAGKASKFKKKTRDHQLEDTVSYMDQQSKIPAAQKELFESFVIDLAEEDREITASFTDQKQWMDRVLELRKKYKVHPRKAQLKKMYERLLEDGTILSRNLSLEQYLTIKRSRSLSGVLVISVLMAPYPRYMDAKTGRVKQQRFTCAHNCYYCPNEPGMPRSYLSTEAAVARATRVDFDAIDQFYARANTLMKLGHDVDKVELLVLGGTFCQFPQDYCVQFIRDLFWAANTFYDGHSNFLDKRPRQSLAEEIKIHELASKCRIIGLTLETRPDTIRDFATIKKFRQYGATRLQIGVQHVQDSVLTHINRGCKHADSVRAVRLLKNAGYKIDIHLMPNLPGSTPEMDEAMFEQMLVDELMQCDQWKVYPCQTVDYSLIKTWYEKGTYKPYSLERLMEVIIAMKSAIHPWIRLNRIFRALPVEHITSGITMSNFRQHMFSRMEDRGAKCKCIRCREVGTHIRREEMAEKQRVCKKKAGCTKVTETLREKLAKEPVLRRRQYKSSGGDEIFISIESEDETVLLGFVRLRCPPQWIKPKDREQLGLKEDEPFLNGFTLPKDGKYGHEAEYKSLNATFPELYRAALVREAHVYGAKQKKQDTQHSTGFGGTANMAAGAKGEDAAKNEVREKQQLTAQSKGYGTRLMHEAEKIAHSKGYSRIAVIAGVGTRLYYRLKLGYKGVGTYMVKDFDQAALGSEGVGDVNAQNARILLSGVMVCTVALLVNYTMMWYLSVMAGLFLASCWLLLLDWLHFIYIDFSPSVNRGLLTLSRLALLLMNLSVVLKICSAFAPEMFGLFDAMAALLGDDEEGNGGDGEGAYDSQADCNCAALWGSTLALYVGGFYLLKMVLVKRMVLLVQNPMFGNDSGVRRVSAQIGALLMTQVVAFAACEFLVLNFTDSRCTAGATEGYDATTAFQCHDTFEALCIWTAFAAIIGDFAIYLTFCRRWYAVMLVLMEEIAIVLQWQCCIVCLCMCSCVLDACIHLSLLYSSTSDDDFDAMRGTFAFVMDVCVIATACCLSFTDSADFVLLALFGESGRNIHQLLENVRYSLHIM